MTHGHPMDRKQGFPVLFEAGDRRREPRAVSVGEAVRRHPSGIEGRSVTHRPEVRHDLCGLVAGEPGTNIGEAVEPAADPHRAGEGRLDGPDQARGTVGRDRGRGPESL
jgi:hypothetical protein